MDFSESKLKSSTSKCVIFSCLLIAILNIDNRLNAILKFYIVLIYFFVTRIFNLVCLCVGLIPLDSDRVNNVSRELPG